MPTRASERGLVLLEPAARWQDALPLGNGTLGALVYGHIAHELIVWNHGAFWRRSPKPELPDMSARLGELRALLAAGDIRAASGFWNRAGPSGYAPIDPYQPAFAVEWKQATRGAFTRYRRTLDFTTGEAEVAWTDAAGPFARTAFVSQPDQVGVLQFAAPAGASSTVRLRLLAHDSLARSSMGAGNDKAAGAGDLRWETIVEADPALALYHGETAVARDGRSAVSSCSAALRILAPGARIRVEGDTFVIEDATAITVLIMAAANLARDTAWVDLRAALARLPAPATLRTRHLERQAEVFGRASLRLGAEPPRLADVASFQRAGADGEVPAAWIGALHDYARHLLIGASWAGDFPRTGWPANLQGIWNGDYAPAWQSDIHNNINIQMNYSPALTGALPESLQPFFDYYEHFLDDYRVNARRFYGCRGIYIPSAQSTHGLAQPEVWAHWTAAAGWLAQHFYDYYLHTGDRAFLRDRAVPFLREAAAFYEDFCTTDAQGRVRFSPSMSPENTPGNAPFPHAYVCTDATMDAAVARELFTHLLAACRELGLDRERWPRWEALLAGLPAYQIAPDGQLREWLDGHSTENPRHRHASHLYGAFPGWEINETTPALAAAAARSLDERLRVGLDEQSGWSLAFQAAAWARLGDGDRALACLEAQVRTCIGPNGLAYHNDWRGQGASMFWGHGNPPPFQIEANFGLACAVQEMLLQSRPDTVKLLPALPARWTEGELRGWSTRAGVRVDLAWSEGGRVWRATLSATRAVAFTLSVPSAGDTPADRPVRLAAGQKAEFAGG